MLYKSFTFVCLAMLVACQPEQADSVQTIMPSSSGARISVADGINQTPPNLIPAEFKDKSAGRVSVKIFKSSRLYGYDISATASVEPGWVAIGGGGFIDSWSNDIEGAFIRSSRPNLDLKSWIVRSSSNVKAECHFLTAYCIGIKIDNVSEATLRSKLKIISTTSPASKNPTIYLNVDTGYTLLGGGAASPGSPLLTSIVSGAGWYAEAMLVPNNSTTTISAYGVECDNKALDAFKLQVTTHYPSSPLYPTSGYISSSLSIPPDRLITAIGARCNTPSTSQRGIVRMYQTNATTLTMLSKDYLRAFSGSNYMAAIAIRSY